MNKQSKWILGVLLFMVLVLGTTLFLSRENLAARVALNDQALFTVIEDEKEVAVYTMSELQALGEVTFEANLKSSGKDPVPYTYQGVLLKDILEDAGVNWEGKTSAIVTAVDGYAVSVSMEKLLDDANVYLAYTSEGELLGSYEEGGRGPYMMVISKDPFSQYWCKYALTVELQ